MKGKYRIKKDDKVIAEVDNLLTNAARIIILQYLAGDLDAWAGAIAIGALDDEPTVEDRRLGFEFGRGSVELISPDVDNSAVIAKATIPREAAGVIHELGIFSSSVQTGNSEDQMLISDFDLGGAVIQNIEPTSLRIGNRSSLVAADGTTEAKFFDIGINISALGREDRFILAYDNNGIDTLELRLLNSEDRYITYTFSPTAGYNSEVWTLDDFNKFGGVSLENNFTELHIVATGVGSIGLDGLRADDTDVMDGQALLSRAVLLDPITKGNSTELEVEYSIEFDFEG